MPSPIDDLTTHLVLLGGGTGLRDDRVGEQLGQWASSSPGAHHQFSVAAKVSGPSVHKEACKAAVAQYAWCLLTPEAMVKLALNMWSPKNAFRQGSELISLQKSKPMYAVASALLFTTKEEAEAYLRSAGLGNGEDGNNGDDGDNGDHEDEGGDGDGDKGWDGGEPLLLAQRLRTCS